LKKALSVSYGKGVLQPPAVFCLSLSPGGGRRGDATARDDLHKSTVKGFFKNYPLPVCL